MRSAQSTPEKSAPNKYSCMTIIPAKIWQCQEYRFQQFIEIDIIWTMSLPVQKFQGTRYLRSRCESGRMLYILKLCPSKKRRHILLGIRLRQDSHRIPLHQSLWLMVAGWNSKYHLAQTLYFRKSCSAAAIGRQSQYLLSIILLLTPDSVSLMISSGSLPIRGVLQYYTIDIACEIAKIKI